MSFSFEFRCRSSRDHGFFSEFEGTVDNEGLLKCLETLISCTELNNVDIIYCSISMWNSRGGSSKKKRRPSPIYRNHEDNFVVLWNHEWKQARRPASCIF